MITQALTRDAVELGSTHPTRDFLYVEDTVRGLIALRGGGRRRGRGDQPRHAASRSRSATSPTSSSGSLDRELPVEFSPERARPAASEVERLLADVSKAERLMGWKSEIALEEGLRRTIEWFGDAVVRYKPSLYNV